MSDVRLIFLTLDIFSIMLAYAILYFKSPYDLHIQGVTIASYFLLH